MAEQQPRKSGELWNEAPSVIGIVGNLGQGKSTSLVWIGLSDLERFPYKEVWSTVPLTEYAKKTYPNLAARWHDIPDFAEWYLEQLRETRNTPAIPNSKLVLIDETALLLPARGSMSAFYQIVSTFPQVARKIGAQLVFVSPLMSQVDLRLRNLLDMGIVTEKRFTEHQKEMFIVLHVFTFDSTTTAQQFAGRIFIEPPTVSETQKCFASMRIDPAISEELITQLEAMLGIKTEKAGKEIVLSESIERVRAFFANRAGQAYDYIRVSREITDMRLTEIKAIVESLADSRFLQIVGSVEGHPTYAYLTPEHRSATFPDEVDAQKILDVFKGKKRLTMSAALALAKMPEASTLFRQLVRAGKLSKKRDYRKGGVTLFFLPKR